MNDELLAIARRLGFDTLETRNSDRLDFREVAVWQVREALQAAYEAGRTAKGGGPGVQPIAPEGPQA